MTTRTSAPVHLGEALQVEFLEPLGLSQNRLAFGHRRGGEACPDQDVCRLPKRVAMSAAWLARVGYAVHVWCGR